MGRRFVSLVVIIPYLTCDRITCMKVSYELTTDDMAALVQLHNARSPTVRRQRYGCLLIGFFAMLSLPALIFLSSEKPLLQTATDIWPLLLGPLLFLMFAIPYLNWRTGNLAKRMYREGRNSGYYGECSIVLEPNGIRESTASGDTVRKWASVEKIVVSRQHLFVYTAGVEAFVVPRRAFATEADFNTFVQQVADKSHVDIQRA
jgi:hypothetical protein